MYLNLNTHENPLIQHTPCELKENPSGWYIEYYCYNPLVGRMERVRNKVNKYRKKLHSDVIARKELKLLCFNINVKLTSGWSPFVGTSKVNFVNLEECIERYLDIKRKELRFESLRFYTSQTNTFRDWLIDRKILRNLPSDFDKSSAIRYLDDIFLNKKVSNRTWNNYRCFQFTFFNWLIERGYCSINPFSNITRKQNEAPNRDVIFIEDRKPIFTYIRENNYPFFIFSLLEYSCLMRPIEIFRTKIENIDLIEQCIHLSGNQTKNKKSRTIIIPNAVIGEIKEYFSKMQISNYDKKLYLFSNNYIPGNIEQTSKKSSATWSKIRKQLNLPLNFKLYSLRDSSILDMLSCEEISPKAVQHHADHSTLAMTTKYSNHESKVVNQQIKENSPDFY